MLMSEDMGRMAKFRKLRDGFKGGRAAVWQEVKGVALTRDFKHTIVERVQRDPEFAKALVIARIPTDFRVRVAGKTG